LWFIFLVVSYRLFGLLGLEKLPQADESWPFNLVSTLAMTLTVSPCFLDLATLNKNNTWQLDAFGCFALLIDHAYWNFTLVRYDLRCVLLRNIKNWHAVELGLHLPQSIYVFSDKYFITADFLALATLQSLIWTMGGSLLLAGAIPVIGLLLSRQMIILRFGEIVTDVDIDIFVG
jgi:hypothetical protein